MKKKIMTRSYLAAGVAAASLLSGCGRPKNQRSSLPRAKGYKPSPKGHTNLEAVKAAFQKYPKIQDFENRVNEICEGKNLVLFRSDKVNGGFKMSALEDLDGNKKISAGDDTLFTLLVANGTATLKGAGVTSYYTSSWPYKPGAEVKNTGTTTNRPHRHTHFNHWYGRSYLWGGGYYTRAPRYDQMMSHRTSYRASNAFASQVKSNAGSQQKMASKYGSGFRAAASTASANRTSHIQKTASSRARASAAARTASRSSFSSSRGSSSRGFSGFRGSSGFEV